MLVFPAIFNSPKTAKYIENYCIDKTNAKCVVSKQFITISPKIDINLVIGKFSIKNKNKDVLSVNNLEAYFNITGKHSVNVRDIYVDIDALKTLLPMKKTGKKSSFNINKLPELSVDNLEIKSKEKVEFYSQIKNFKILKENDKRKNIFFDAKIILPKPLHPVIILSNKNLYIENNALSADDLKVMFGDNKITVVGNILTPDKNPDLHIFAKNLKSQDVVNMVIFIHNISDKHKKFIENFRNFTGFLATDLHFKDKKLNGKISADNLKAYTVLFNLPVICPKTTMTINDNLMEGTMVGTAGTEKISHKIKITDMLSTENRTVNGEVRSKITERLVKKYLPQQYKIKSDANIFITYHIKNQKINVKYYADLKKGADLYYKHANLGVEDKERRFFAHTYKYGDNMYLKSYNYSVMNNGKANEIVIGDGLFVRINNKFKPQYITVKTNGYAPVSVIGGIGKYVWGGYFKGNLKYDYNKTKLTGVFNITDTYFNHFRVKNANVIATDNDLFVKANGTYRKENFYSEMQAKNNLFEEDRMKVYNLDLFLDKYKFSKPHKLHTHKKKIDISKYVRKVRMDIEKYNIKVNSITVNHAIASDIQIKGSIKDSLFAFNILNIDFANGKMIAKGSYDFNKNDSHIDFMANNIDANIVGTQVFDLPGYIVGIASADFHTDTYNKLENLKGQFKFKIDGGYLPKIGNMKFMTDKADKTKFIKPQDYTNVDLSGTNSLKSNIFCTFKLDNQHIYDVELTSQQEALALYIEGDYDKIKNYADITVYGKYNPNAAKKVKIIHIPLKWILNYLFFEEQPKSDYPIQLDKIPSINIPEDKQKYFMIKVNGNLKDKNNVTYEMKGLK